MAGSGRLALMYVAMFALFIGVGYVIGTLLWGDWLLGSLIFLGIVAALNLITYAYSDKIVLWSYRAKIVTEKEQPRLYRTVQRVAQLSNLPMPKVAIVDTPTPNAFATGRNPKNAVVAATTGILQILDDRELTGVLAHEMAHVKDRDILVVSIAATVAGAIAFLTRMFFWTSLFGGVRRDRGGDSGLLLILAFIAMILAPIAAMLLQLAISRSREYKADKVGAKTLGVPGALADALEKLEYHNRRRPFTFGNPTHASLFIVNPFRGSSLASLFSTHPPIKERVRRLRQMAREMGAA